MLKPIPQRSRVCMQIVEQIREQIKSGYYKPGSCLPSERELAEILQVSRSSVREAVTILESQGILEARPGKGTYVRDAEDYGMINRYFDTFSLIFEIEPARTLQLLEVRKMLEPGAAGLAAQKASSSDKTALRLILEELKAVYARAAVSEETDFRFHYQVAACTGNEVLLSTLNALADLMRRALQQTSWMSVTDPERVKKTVKEHESIVYAIEKGDSAEAYSSMLRHLEEVEANFIYYLKEDKL